MSTLRKIFFAVAASACLGSFAGATDGRHIIIINEDWYGHQNSTVNVLCPDEPEGVYWDYRVIQQANPGKELGCTNQYGAIWGDRLYLIAKQDKDPGASVQGGRITVADARTLKIVKQLPTIDPSGSQCDGRAFVGVSAEKGYVSTSNGIWILDLTTLTVTGKVSGTENPNAGGDADKPNWDPTGSLYKGQTGTMVLAEGRVFAVHQQYGLLVIDPATDRVVRVLDMELVADAIAAETGTAPTALPGIGSTIVRSRDGMLWHSLSKDDQGLGTTLPYIVRVDPITLERQVIPIKGEGMNPPSNSWYAWTPDPFIASATANELYWCGGSNRWFSKDVIYRYDIASGSISKFADLAADTDGGWHVYGCSLGIDPSTDQLYASLYHDFQDPTYTVRRFGSDGEADRDYPMISNYWFPSCMIFVDYAPGREPGAIEPTGLEADDSRPAYYDLYGRFLGHDASTLTGIVIEVTPTGARKIAL